MRQEAEVRAATRRRSTPSRFPETQLGVHLADVDTADALTMHSGGSGLIMGVNQHGKPVTVTLFRSEPTLALAVGSVRFAQVIAFRALALGAEVVVQTARPNAWAAFGAESAADLGAHAISRHNTHQHAGSAEQPHLLVVDSLSSAVADAEAPSGAAWSSVLTVHSQLSAWESPALARADLALMQRLSASEARLACPIFNVAGHEDAITRLPDDMVAVITHSELRWASLAQTMVERRLIGVADRAAEAGLGGIGG